MQKHLLILLAVSLFFISCEVEDEKKEQSFAPLKKIEIPDTVIGFYVGELPCDDCKKLQVKIDLDSTGKASVEEVFFRDSISKVESAATYKDSLDVVTITFPNKNKKWQFKRKNILSLIYLDFSGEPSYMDSGLPYQLLKILKRPVQ